MRTIKRVYRLNPIYYNSSYDCSTKTNDETRCTNSTKQQSVIRNNEDAVQKGKVKKNRSKSDDGKNLKSLAPISIGVGSKAENDCEEVQSELSKLTDLSAKLQKY